MDYTNKIPELQADVKTIWKLQCNNLYNSKNLGALAVRECLQNSIDAINTAVKLGQISQEDGCIKITYNEEDSTVVIEDNGCGMDIETIHNKFLCLGGTTKGDEDNVGGFGLAKAVILGCGAEFEIHTQDNYLSSQDLGVKPITKVEFRQGTRMTLYKVQVDKNQLLEECSYKFVGAIYSYVASSEIPYPVYVNGIELEPKFERTSKSYRSPATFNISSDMVPHNTKLRINVYKSGNDSSRMLYVRLRGLTQFTQYLGWNANCDIVLDFQTKLDPRDTDYPFSTNREGLKAQFQGITEAIRDKVNQSPLSISDNDRYKETYFENTHNSVDRERTIFNMFSKKETIELVKSVQKLVTAIPNNLPGIQPQGGYTQPTIADRAVQYQQQLQEVAEMEGLTVEEYVQTMDEDKLMEIKNPLEYSWLIWEDKQLKGKRIRENKAVEFIVLWDSILRVMAEKSNMANGKVFYPGIIIKEDTLGMCVEKTLDNGENRVYIMLNPFEIPYKDPMQTALWLMGVASHELAHFVCGCFEAHGETFAYTREAIMNNCLEEVVRIVKLVKDSKLLSMVNKLVNPPSKNNEYTGKSLDELISMAEDRQLNVAELQNKYSNEAILKMRVIMLLKKGGN